MGYIACKHCHGIEKKHTNGGYFQNVAHIDCNGLGDIWVDNIDEYFNKQT